MKDALRNKVEEASNRCFGTHFNWHRYLVIAQLRTGRFLPLFGIDSQLMRRCAMSVCQLVRYAGWTGLSDGKP